MQFDSIEEMLCGIASLGREDLTEQLLNFPAPFSIDFTPDFLQDQSVDRLRHLLFAVCTQCRQTPKSRSPEPVAA